MKYKQFRDVFRSLLLWQISGRFKSPPLRLQEWLQRTGFSANSVWWLLAKGSQDDFQQLFSYNYSIFSAQRRIEICIFRLQNENPFKNYAWTWWVSCNGSNCDWLFTGNVNPSKKWAELERRLEEGFNQAAFSFGSSAGMGLPSETKIEPDRKFNTGIKRTSLAGI